ncbi:MAG: hypothetical protein WCO54_09635 [Bacteroidota bacterium]
MKTLVTITLAAVLFTSCTKPTPDVSVSSKSSAPNQTIQIANMSFGGDVTYIKMNGVGTKDCCTPVSKNMLIDDKSFCFKYTEVGNYSIEVIVESTSYFGGTETTTKSEYISIIDPNAIPIPPVTPSLDKNNKHLNNNSNEVVAPPMVTIPSKDDQNISHDTKKLWDR